MKAKICREVNCNNLIDGALTYCEKHTRGKRLPFQNAIRTNDKLYNTSKWKEIRKRILHNQRYCKECRATENLEIHHIVPPRGDDLLFFDMGNLIPLCKACHRVVTAREIRNPYPV